MEGQQLAIGRLYAYRERRSAHCPLRKVKLIDIVGRRGKVKIRFEDGPHPGLEEYVSTRQIVISWADRKALLRDEERAALLEEYEKGAGAVEKALSDAAEAVLEATGEPGCGMDQGEVQRILDRAGIEKGPTDLHHLAYRDRHGQIHLPGEAMVALAQAFAAAEPETVVIYLDDRDDELRIRGNQPGDRWYHQYRRELSPSFALARQWAGLEQESEMLRKEIARLRGLLSTAAHDLKRAGEERKSNRLLRALEGR